MGESEFAQPVSKPFKLNVPLPFGYTTISPDSIKPPRTIQLDLEKLPLKPFTINDFKLLKTPIQQTKLDWDHIPDSNFNLDIAPAKPFRLQQSILPKPAIAKAGMPKLMTNTTSGVLQFGEEEGLPGSRITASLVDKYGSIWLATEKGLCRYTGEMLFIYSFLNKTPQGSDYTITKMAIDKEGNIWVVTDGDGIYIINTSANILLHHPTDLYYSDIICDHAGMVWVTSYFNGLFVIDAQRKTIKNINSYSEKKSENAIYCIAKDQHNNIWFAFDGHIAILDSARQQVKTISKKEGLSNDFVLKLLEDKNGDMWIGGYGNGVNYISLKNKVVGTLDNKNGFAGMGIEMVEDDQQQIWLFRRDTSYILNKERTAIKQVLMDIKMLQSNVRGSSLIDPNGNIWVGSLNKGAVIIDSRGPLPEHLTTKEGLADNNVWGILEEKKGNIWLSTRQGINIYDPLKNQIKLLGTGQGLDNDRAGRITDDVQGNIFIANATGFSIINQEKKTLTNYGKDQQLPGSFSKCIVDSSGQLWLSSYIIGIIIYDVTKNSSKIINKSTGLLSNVTWDMVADRQGNIWAGSDSGITIINPINNTVQYLREKDGLCNNVIYKMVLHPNGEIWAGTLKGISIINTNNFTITNLTRKEGLFPEEIYDMVEQKGTIYAGTSDGLIAIKKPDTSFRKNSQWRFVNYGKREGFPYNDYNQNTGIATKNGQTWWGITPVLTVVTQQPQTDTVTSSVFITRMNIMDEFPSFFSYATLKNQLTASDTLWNENKSSYFLKNNLPKDSGYLTVNNIRWDSTTSMFKMPLGLTLPHHQNSINFSFTNTDVRGRDKIAYRYILEGYDEDWSEISGRPFSKNYYNLSPAVYTFKVCTKGFNGLWSKPAILSFTVRSPWWQTWWAYILYTLAAAFIITAYTGYRSRQLHRKNVELENKINERTTELSKSLTDLKATQTQLIQSEKMASLGELTAGIAHEIQNPLNFVNNFSEVNAELIAEMKQEINKGNFEEVKLLAKDIEENEQKIVFHGKRADGIVKGMLQHSRSSNGQKEPTDINELADEYLRLSYHGLRAKDKSFNANFKTDFDSSIGKINIIPQDIGRVILNLLTNAFYAVTEKKNGLHLQKEGNGTYEPTVTITTRKVVTPSGDKGVAIKVSDNGNGIPPKALDKIFQPFFTTKPTGQGTGLGLSMSYDIITKGHGGEIKVNTKEGEGSEFIISLPIV